MSRTKSRTTSRAASRIETARAEETFHLLDDAYPKVIEFIESESAFQHLIAVILSAQTTDRQVNAVLPVLFSRYPGPADLKSAAVEDIERIIKPLGYYRVKARHIIAAAGGIHDIFHDAVPSAMDDLLSLPGVGRKTAHVIRGRCFGLPAVIVDTHFFRVVRRLGLTDRKQADAVERDIASLLAPEYQYRFSMTVNLHGRTICTARKPQCGACVLEHICPKLI